MFLNILSPKPVLDEESTLWLFDTFAWALRNLDARVFYEETILVTPSNEHFPGRENSAHGMANLIFNQVKEHAGLQHWPCKLVNIADSLPTDPPSLVIEGPLRGSRAIMPAAIEERNKLAISYDPDQLRDPEVLIATNSISL